MTDFPVVSKVPHGTAVDILRFQNIAAITSGTGKAKFVVLRPSRIVDVVIDSDTAGSGGVSDIIDINVNGTTIYTTQANRPTLLAADTGMWTEAGEPEVTILQVGDIITVDIDQTATTGSALVSVNIITVAR